MKRTDPHRPGAIVPAHYQPVLAYNCATSQDGWPVPSFGINCELDRRVVDGDGRFVRNGAHSPGGECCTIDCHRRAHETGHVVFGGPGKCGSCGAWFVYGELWRHEPTGDLVHLGHDCALKYGLMMDRSDAEIANGRARTAIATQIRRAERADDRAAFLAAHQGLAEAFEVGDAASPTRGAQIIADIADRFVNFCSLSDKQVALVLKLAEDIRNPRPPAPEDVKVPAPFGKGVEFAGVITSAKLRESEYGCTWKIAIKVAAEGGCWIAWGSAPAGIMAHAVAIADTQRGDRADLIRAALVGMSVDIKATLEKPAVRSTFDVETDAERAVIERRNTENHFAFMVRPNGVPVRFNHPVKSAKRIAAERAFERAIDEERSAMRAVGGSHFGAMIVSHDDVVASLASKGITLDALVAVSLEKPSPKARRAAKKKPEPEPVATAA